VSTEGGGGGGGGGLHCEYNMSLSLSLSLSLPPQVDNLTEGTFYEFKIQAANMAGVGVASAPSAPLRCEAWTNEEPGGSHCFSNRLKVLIRKRNKNQKQRIKLPYPH